MTLLKNTEECFLPSELLNQSLAPVLVVLVKSLLDWVSDDSKKFVLILLGVTDGMQKMSFFIWRDSS